MPRPRQRRRERKVVPRGRAYIHSTFNNTVIALTDLVGNVIASASAGTAGFRGSRKGTAFAAQRAAELARKTGYGAWSSACGCLYSGTWSRT